MAAPQMYFAARSENVPVLMRKLASMRNDESQHEADTSNAAQQRGAMNRGGHVSNARCQLLADSRTAGPTDATAASDIAERTGLRSPRDSYATIHHRTIQRVGRETATEWIPRRSRPSRITVPKD